MDHPVERMETPPATVHAWYPEAIAIAKKIALASAGQAKALEPCAFPRFC